MNDDDVAEFFQDMMLAALSGEAGFHPERGGLAWLKKIALNLMRKRTREHEYNSRHGVDFQNGVDLSDVESKPIGFDFETDDLASLAQALIQLEPEQRQVIVSAFLDHRRGIDLANALDPCTLGNSRVKKHRALKELRRQFFAVRHSGVD